MTENQQTALVLFSGGQDSTTCLAWALQRYDSVETIGFDYGQRHRVELECRGVILGDIGNREKLGDDHLIAVPSLNQVGETALTRNVAIAMTDTGLPNTFVPGRNIVFLALAAALAYRRGISHIVTGVCQTDYSGYPDCRSSTIDAVQQAVTLGMSRDVTIHTPLMHLTKAETWALAREIGGQDLIDLIREQTHTCYNGVRDIFHDWGIGCGECPACEIRAKGFAEYIENSLPL